MKVKLQKIYWKKEKWNLFNITFITEWIASEMTFYKM